MCICVCMIYMFDMYVTGNVYNVTSYMEFHPGGEDELMRGVGKDATELFNEVRGLEHCRVRRMISFLLI